MVVFFFLLGDTKNPPEYGPGLSAVGVPAGGGSLDQVMSSSPFQP